MPLAQKGSNASTTTTTTNVDKSIQLGGNGYVLALQDNKIDAGASLSITTADPAIVADALEVTSRLAMRTADSADKVAQSQEKFVATATGQKTITYIVAGLAVVALLPMLIRKRA